MTKRKMDDILYVNEANQNNLNIPTTCIQIPLLQPMPTLLGVTSSVFSKNTENILKNCSQNYYLTVERDTSQIKNGHNTDIVTLIFIKERSVFKIIIEISVIHYNLYKYKMNYTINDICDGKEVISITESDIISKIVHIYMNNIDKTQKEPLSYSDNCIKNSSCNDPIFYTNIPSSKLISNNESMPLEKTYPLKIYGILHHLAILNNVAHELITSIDSLYLSFLSSHQHHSKKMLAAFVFFRLIRGNAKIQITTKISISEKNYLKYRVRYTVNNHYDNSDKSFETKSDVITEILRISNIYH